MPTIDDIRHINFYDGRWHIHIKDNMIIICAHAQDFIHHAQEIDLSEEDAITVVNYIQSCGEQIINRFKSCYDQEVKDLCDHYEMVFEDGADYHQFAVENTNNTDDIALHRARYNEVKHVTAQLFIDEFQDLTESFREKIKCIRNTTCDTTD